MSEALDHIEAAIGEVTSARAAVMRSRSKQVRAADERQRLKAVAFAWFQTHRPRILGVDLSSVDESYKDILDSTAKLAARTTYADALKRAKAQLVSVRRGVASGVEPSRSDGPEVQGAFRPEPPPAFASLAADAVMQAILVRRWDEVQRCVIGGANLAATVMMGGLLESLLLARINLSSDKKPIFTAKAAPVDKKSGAPLPLTAWKLAAMVEVAHEVGWITKSAKDVGNVLRDFRNYVHPHKEHADAIVITNEDARMFWEVSKSISRQVLGSVGNRP